MNFRCALAAAVVLGVGFLQACGREPSATPPAPSRVWSEYVSGHTAGLVSRKARITVQFTQDVATPEQVGKSAEDALSIEPEIDGDLVFSGPREITLTPEEPLPRGRDFRARLDPEELQNVPKNLAPYEFHFSVMPARFDLSTAGLEAALGNDAVLQLRGTLETADSEDDAAVEKLLRATYLGKPLELAWVHANENREHHFSAQDLTRTEDGAQVQLQWSGEALGIDSAGSRFLEVPPRDVFKVLDASTRMDGRRSIVVRFSDLLDPQQNLKGLVTLGKLKLSTAIEGNALRIYPETALTGDVQLEVSGGVRNARRVRLGQAYQATLTFADEKPRVRFAGKGVILPDNERLTIPLEGMNVGSIQVTALQVFDSNIGQFLQSNSLSQSSEIHRVGRYLWRKTIQLPSPQGNQWTRYALDVSDLLRRHPGALFRLTVSINRGNSLYTCGGADAETAVWKEDPQRNQEDPQFTESSGWDGIEDYYYGGEQPDWQERDNPCKDAYYRWGEAVKDSRNFLASNIGLIAKRGTGGALRVVATNLRTAEPLSGVEIEVRNFQDQRIATGKSDSAGFASIELDATPFYLVARSAKQVGYLKLSRGVALPTSHFDTGGETVTGGIKGFIFGERGVWRPGDDIFLTFMLDDRDGRIPPDHPVTLQLFDPKGTLVKTVTNTQPVEDFYAFTLRTAEDAPTGTWSVKALVGGAEFSQRLKIETVMPNRLKMELRVPGGALAKSAMPAKTALWSQWLHGASAKGLKADVAGRLVQVPTRFTRNSDFVFDDPTRTLTSERQTLFEGSLDDTGLAEFNLNLQPASDAPGMLRAEFTTRVFEEGGAFSTGQSEFPYHPYEHYVGLKLPKGDATRGMLLTDIQHPVEIAALDAQGEPAKVESVELNVYKIQWRWWWEKGQDNLAQFSESEYASPISQQTVTLKGGKGTGRLEVKYPDWGRYLVRICDPKGGHCAGQVIYMDWPGWAGRAQEQAGPAASALNFFSDKPKYTAGETAILQLPDATQGRALLSLENGRGILEQRWLQLEPGKTRIEIPLTGAMAPVVYASITLIQPHAGKANDRPIRVYGILPLEVTDPATVLSPVIKADSLWRPGGKVSVQVSEQQGREMTYTLAVVDEGLLGLTSHKTPDPHRNFYRREALGVQTWDLFDEVAGAYGGELERLLALGGDEGGVRADRQEQKRFPPVVRVLGPFQLGKGRTDTREFDLPEYIGELRVMVVAGYRGAYGSAQHSVTVRTPLSLLATLPRVLGPGETVTLPVSLFSFEPEVRDVKLKLEADAELFEVLESPGTVHFDQPGEKVAAFTLRSKSRTGIGKITVHAEAGPHRSVATIHLPVQPQNPSIASVVRKELAPGEEWKTEIKPFGVAGTTRATLEVSRVPPIDLERRLQYLVLYPHGCLEQTVSAAFPQLYLDLLMDLDEGARKRVQDNVHAGIERLRMFQSGGQAFTYWPGNPEVSAWANNYAGHFLVEAKRLGYAVPAAMYEGWVDFQRDAAARWAPGGFDSADNQAYRLLTLALADQPDVGAMNRLREQTLGSLARWNLASAYAQVGLQDAARDVMRNASVPAAYAAPGPTFGSDTRDDGVLLSTLALLGESEQAQRTLERLSRQLASNGWFSTQSTAYALMGIARYSGRLSGSDTFSFSYAQDAGAMAAVTARRSLSSRPLERLLTGGTLTVKNTSQQKVFASAVLRGSPEPGGERAVSEGLALHVDYTRISGEPVSIASLQQGTDFVAHVAVTNQAGVALDDLALTHPVAAGWQIHNPRFEGAADETSLDYQDIRDARVLSYFKLAPGQTLRLKVLINASYRGHYYLPALSVESMYDARKHAQTAGQWVDVVRETP